MGIMSHETAEHLLRAAAQAAESGDVIQITFQGGEPTLAGLDFFRDFVAMEGELIPSGVTVNHSIQTNGMAVTAEWAEFFRANRFLVGLSLDGARDLHDALRVDPQGKGTWNRAVAALHELDKAGGGDKPSLCGHWAHGPQPSKGVPVFEQIGQSSPSVYPLPGPSGGSPGQHALLTLPSALRTLFVRPV